MSVVLPSNNSRGVGCSWNHWYQTIRLARSAGEGDKRQKYKLLGLDLAWAIREPVGVVREPPLLHEITAYFRCPENQPGWGGPGGKGGGIPAKLDV